MSWWVSLRKEEGEAVTVTSHVQGGTYAVGGTTEASLNITYNYSQLFRQAMGGEGLWDLNGKKASEAVPVLENAIGNLGIQGIDGADHWAATPYNAGYALSILLTWAREHPSAVFVVH